MSVLIEKFQEKDCTGKSVLLCSHTLSSRVLDNDKSSLLDDKDYEWDAKINLILERNLIVFRLCYLVYQKWGQGQSDV